jgi:hypothetical protein
VGTLARGGEDDAGEIAGAVGGGEERPLAGADLDEAAGAQVVEDDALVGADEVAAHEDVVAEARAEREGGGRPGAARAHAPGISPGLQER